MHRIFAKVEYLCQVIKTMIDGLSVGQQQLIHGFALDSSPCMSQTDSVKEAKCLSLLTELVRRTFSVLLPPNPSKMNMRRLLAGLQGANVLLSFSSIFCVQNACTLFFSFLLLLSLLLMV